jgi:hypothetical protein
MSSRLWIGMITFYVLAIVICNVMEGAQMTATVNTDLGFMTEHKQTATVDAVGNTADFWTVSTNMLNTFRKVIFFDYSMFYDINNLDPVTGKPMANDFAIFRYMLIAIGIVMVVEVVIAIRGSISK